MERSGQTAFERRVAAMAAGEASGSEAFGPVDDESRLGLIKAYMGWTRRRRLDFEEEIQKGFSVASVSKFAEQELQQSPTAFFVKQIRLSRQTLDRRKAAGRLTASESDRALRFVRLMAQAQELMGSREKARKWLNTALPALNGKTPLETATTEQGARRVEDLVIALQHGMFS